MSIFKDWRDDNKDYVFKTQVVKFFSPREWLRFHKYRKQRADRGWSDRDAWNAGDHIADMTAQMLQYLISEKGHADWPEWFRLNVEENGKDAYKDLQSVIDDIKNYTEFQWTSWADDLESTHDGDDENYKIVWTKNGKKVPEAEITKRIKEWHSKERNLYKKSSKAMQFFGRYYTQFWD